MKHTYIDSGVLIEAMQGNSGTAVSFQAQRILLEPDREFTSSIFVKLEVLPKATYYKKNAAEVAFFYEDFFFQLSGTLGSSRRSPHASSISACLRLEGLSREEPTNGGSCCSCGCCYRSCFGHTPVRYLKYDPKRRRKDRGRYISAVK